MCAFLDSIFSQEIPTLQFLTHRRTQEEKHRIPQTNMGTIPKVMRIHADERMYSLKIYIFSDTHTMSRYSMSILYLGIAECVEVILSVY